MSEFENILNEYRWYLYTLDIIVNSKNDYIVLAVRNTNDGIHVHIPYMEGNIVFPTYMLECLNIDNEFIQESFNKEENINIFLKGEDAVAFKLRVRNI